MADSKASPTAIPKPRRRRPESYEAEAKFRARLEALDAKLLDPYLGSKAKHRVICSEGHECTPKAERVIAGGGVCRICSGCDSATAWATFKTRVEELGGTVVEPSWRGVGVKHEIRCKEGHTSYPYPGRVAQGVGICRVCAGLDPAEAVRQLLVRLDEIGAVLLDPYRSANKPVRFRCAEGHEFTGRPAVVVRSPHVCRVCAGLDPASRLAAFRALVEAQGGTLLATRWLGVHEPHDVLCSEGHLCSPRPAGLPEKSICRICACRDPHVVEERFRERVAELGGTVIGEWFNIHESVLVRCSEGHEASPIPKNVIYGGGLCRFCKGKVWDAFYVVADEINDVVKIGITSGNPRPRLLHHERSGLDQVVRLHTGLPSSVAPELEQTLLAALRDAGEKPVRGREYFATRVLPVVLDLVDNHPAIRA
ncbi:GIY-YIG nuclease family protein [Streptomyces sp. NPDC126510]|uniref:GIY-YIG nuclease family protein n=1 Tax=Streptomyces sp. NPDC126510 TaxID=3155317 RepID=UPI00331CDF13